MASDISELVAAILDEAQDDIVPISRALWLARESENGTSPDSAAELLARALSQMIDAGQACLIRYLPSPESRSVGTWSRVGGTGDEIAYKLRREIAEHEQSGRDRPVLPGDIGWISLFPVVLRRGSSTVSVEEPPQGDPDRGSA